MKQLTPKQRAASQKLLEEGFAKLAVLRALLAEWQAESDARGKERLTGEASHPPHVEKETRR